MSDQGPRYFGIYRGTVVSNIDPNGLARLSVTVPAVSGMLPQLWAMPCLPAAGKQSGVHIVPDVGSGVWVMYEGGDPNRPVWMGCWWGTRAEVPALVQAATPGVPPIVMQTGGQTTLMLSDTPGPTGGILLKTSTGAMISINQTGIVITNGQGATIALSGPTVTVNQGALAVT